MQAADVQLRSNGAWFLIQILTRSMNFFDELRKTPLINPCFVTDEWQEWKFRYLPVFVGFLYTVVFSVPLD